MVGVANAKSRLEGAAISGPCCEVIRIGGCCVGRSWPVSESASRPTWKNQQLATKGSAGIGRRAFAAGECSISVLPKPGFGARRKRRDGHSSRSAVKVWSSPYAHSPRPWGHQARTANRPRKGIHGPSSLMHGQQEGHPPRGFAIRHLCSRTPVSEPGRRMAAASTFAWFSTGVGARPRP